MTAVFTMILLALVTALIAVFLRNGGFSVLALVAAVLGGVLILLKLIPYLREMFVSLRALSDGAGLSVDYLGLVLKAAVIAYIGEFSAQLCRDVGEGGLAEKVDLGTKVVIMVMALPLLNTIVTTVTAICR